MKPPRISRSQCSKLIKLFIWNPVPYTDILAMPCTLLWSIIIIDPLMFWGVSGQCGHWTVMVLWARLDLSRARAIVLYLFNWDQASYLWGSAVTAVLCFPSPQPRKMHYLPQWIADTPMVTRTSFKGLDQSEKLICRLLLIGQYEL